MTKFQINIFHIVIAIIAIIATGAIFEWIHGASQRNAETGRQDRLQIALIRATMDNEAIGTEAAKLLNAVPSAARVRVGFIHQDSGSTTPLLRYDVVVAVAAPGFVPGALYANVTISEWNTYLKTLLDHQCQFIRLDASRDSTALAKLTDTNIKAFIACPIESRDNLLIGAVWLSWDSFEALPQDITSQEIALAKFAQFVARLHQ